MDSKPTTLVLGGTGRTGSLVAQKLIERGLSARTASRDGADVLFDWVPADYAVMLRWLTGTIISGNGSRPNDDIEKDTGRPPITFQDFARRNAPARALQAAK